MVMYVYRLAIDAILYKRQGHAVRFQQILELYIL